VVVFCRFKHDLRAVERAADSVAWTYGELSGSRRDGLSEDGTLANHVDILGAQIRAGSLGVDLTRARYAVYYSQTFSLGDYDQSLARLNRSGQTRPVHYYHLIVEGTVDRAIYRTLARRRDDVEAVLEALRKVG
jgi:SNF2 family DNA or RNA helicase